MSATARLTVDSCTSRAAATSARVNGFSAVAPYQELPLLLDRVLGDSPQGIPPLAELAKERLRPRDGALRGVGGRRAGHHRARADREAWQWLQKHEHAARMLLTQLDALASVLTQVAAVAVRRRKDFLDRGPAGDVELTRSDVARELDLHPSKVARAVRAKVVRTPSDQLIDFEDLFGTAVALRAEMVQLVWGSASSDARPCLALRARGHTGA